MERTSYAAYVQLADPDGGIIYSGEAIYRPRKLDPLTGEPTPTIGIPDDAMQVRPSGLLSYRISFNGDQIPTSSVYLERVATCWWFALERPPRHPPTV